MGVYCVMRDSFMSGWGPAEGKQNLMCVECETQEQAQQIEAAAKRRPEMHDVHITSKPPVNDEFTLVTRHPYNELHGSWKAPA